LPQLADRVDRLLAILVDLVVALPVVATVGIYTGEFSAIFHHEPIPWEVYAQNAIAAWGWFFIVNGYLLSTYGQTVGKRFLMIRIADYATAAVPPLWRLLVRIAVPSAAGLFGALGSLFNLVDVLFIFRNDHRCIHDLIASTRVVKA